MPELPAVEYTRKIIERNALNTTVSLIEFPNIVPDELIFSKEAAEFVKRIVGHQVKEVGRWGKQLWIILESENAIFTALLIHLGMTGFVQFEGGDRLKYESSPSRGAPTNIWPPRFTKFMLQFTGRDGNMTTAKMAFCDARRLGKINVMGLNLFGDSRMQDRLGLGFDPLVSMPSFKEFHDQLTQLQKKRKINVKTLLMEQRFVAGLGNWMVDDILMMAGILPDRKIFALNETELGKLHKSIREVTTIAVVVDADKSKFPKNWLFHIRWQHGKETLTGMKVKNEKISGRSTFWIPELQK